MASVTYDKCNLWQRYYGKCNRALKCYFTVKRKKCKMFIQLSHLSSKLQNGGYRYQFKNKDTSPYSPPPSSCMQVKFFQIRCPLDQGLQIKFNIFNLILEILHAKARTEMRFQDWENRSQKSYKGSQKCRNGNPLAGSTRYIFVHPGKYSSCKLKPTLSHIHWT